MAGIATLLASSKQQAASSKQQAASSKQQASKRSGAALFCQPLSAQFYRKPRDRDVCRHRRTVPMNVAVFFAFPTGLDPGGGWNSAKEGCG